MKKYKRYAYGGEGDGKPKRVKTVPVGYEPDPDFKDSANPNRKYYRKVSGSLNASKSAPKSTNSKPIIKKSGHKRTTPVKPVVTPSANIGIDRVYLEDEPVAITPTDAPAKAIRGENIFTRLSNGSNRAIGMAKYPSRNSIGRADGGILNEGNQDVEFQYYLPNTSIPDGESINIPSGDWNTRGYTSNYADTSFINKYRKPIVAKKMANGGVAGGWGAIAQNAPLLLDAIIGAIDGNQPYNKQPIINPSSARAMVSPYAFGGTVEDLEEQELAELQEYADTEGISLEEAFEILNSQYAEQQAQSVGQNVTAPEEVLGDSGENQQYATGGWIKKAADSIKRRGTKGKCTPITKPGCTGKAKALALTFKRIAKNRHAMGGVADINVEGNEIIDAPGVQPFKVTGPSHENGGIDMTVPEGTKIFSDRLMVDGKTMQQRKASRERKLGRYKKQLENKYSSVVLKNGYKRTMETTGKEEQQDMLLQTIANRIFNAPTKHAAGGYAGGPPDVPMLDYEIPQTGAWWENYQQPLELPPTPTDPTGATGYFGPDTIAGAEMSGFGTTPPNTDQPFTVGDYVGMAGTVFNGIAPLINTRNAALATKPAVNRYRGFGRRAIEANQSAQNLAGQTLTDDLTDIDTSYGSAIEANRNSASSVNTQRALNIAASIARDRARTGARGTNLNARIGLLDRSGALTNAQDQYEMFGQTQADQINRDIMDNYFTNHGQDLINFGNSVSTIGGNINTAHANNVDANLLSQLSMYGLGFDANGNLISTRK